MRNLIGVGVLVVVCFPVYSSATETEPDLLPTLGELRERVSGSLRAEAISRREGDNTPEVLALIDTYLALAGDPRRDESPTIQKLGLRVKVRLHLLRKRIARKVARDAPVVAPGVVVPPKREILAQQVGGAVPFGVGNGGVGNGGAGNPTAGNRPNDFGADLVDLIQRTISPEVWDINGGTSSVVYYQPWHALVVSAPGEVHRNVGNVLRDMRGE